MLYDDLRVLGYPTVARRLSRAAQSIEVLRPDVESLVVHVLFIDLVGYSKLSMCEQNKASCELTACVQSIPEYCAALISQTITCLDTGDGMALIFEGDPTAPALAALQIAECRGKNPSRPIRMGLHSGPATRVRDINGRLNYKGVGVNVAQRVMDCARPAQITMTDHYASIVTCYAGWQERVVSRGVHTVKHGLHLRVSELLYPFSPRQPVSVLLHQELPAVKPVVRWTAIGVVLAFMFTMMMLVATSQVHPEDDTPLTKFWKANISLMGKTTSNP